MITSIEKENGKTVSVVEAATAFEKLLEHWVSDLRVEGAWLPSG